MILCSQAKLENDNRGVNVKSGIRAKCEMGWRPAPAPIGYLNYSHAGVKKVMLDQATAQIIKEMFILVANKGYSGRNIKVWLDDDVKLRTQKGTIKDHLLEQELLPAFKALKVTDPDLLNWISKALKETHEVETGSYLTATYELSKREETIKKRLVALYTDKLDGKITESFYNTMYSEYMVERETVEKHRKSVNTRDKTFYDKTAALYDIAQKSEDTYLKLLPEKRRKLIRLVFTNLKLNNGKFTYEYTDIFSKLAEAIKNTNSSKVSGNEEFKKKILEQANFIGVKANTGVFESTHSIWLSM